MKKVFAFLSTMLLTIAFVGLFSGEPVAKAAVEKFTEDPTLAEDEIPVYIMDSIHITFPAYYDNDAKKDPNSDAARMTYAWNETRLRIAQLNPDGTPTGKYYAVFFPGHDATGGRQGAGDNVVGWDVDENGQSIAIKYSGGKTYGSGNQHDPSLSSMRVNKSDQDVTVSIYEAGSKMKWNDEEAKNYFNRVIVFDGQGRAVRGIGLDALYSKDASKYVQFTPEYCYVDGVGKRIADLESPDLCDKEQVQVFEDGVDPETNEPVKIPVTDKDGNPVYQDGTEPAYVYGRFIWNWFETEPTNVNENGYLGEGWNPDNWDDVYEKDGGYMAIAFVNSEGSFTLEKNAKQVEAYAKTIYDAALAANPEMTEEEKLAALEAATKQAKGHTRAVAHTFVVPAHGFTYYHGFLDKGLTGPDTAASETVVYGYLYGRNLIDTGEVDEEGNPIKVGMGQPRTYNFSTADLTFDSAVVNGNSYQLLDGQMVVEIMQGDVYNASAQINYDGIKKYWTVENDVFSYSQNDEDCDFTIVESENGAPGIKKVEPLVYKTLDEIKHDFYEDVAAWKGVTYTPGMYDNNYKDSGLNAWNTFCPTSKANAEKDTRADFCAFIDSETGQTMLEKWEWLFIKVRDLMLTYPQTEGSYKDSLNSWEGLLLNGYTGSSDRLGMGIYCYLQNKSHVGDGSMGYGFEGVADDWLEDQSSSYERWTQYTLDASTKAPGDNWVVNYSVINNGKLDAEGNPCSSSVTIKYVVVDSYTPILEVAKPSYRFEGKLAVSGKYEIDPIDEYSLVKAYDAQYNGVDIKGNDISQNIIFETELDFDNPREGTYEVKVTIKNNAGTKQASKTFEVEVADLSAPIGLTRNVTILQGQDFFCLDGIVLAYDVVDGNLFDAQRKWYRETSKAVDTNKVNAGKPTTEHNISVEISDASGNKRTLTYKLTIIAKEAVNETLEEKFGELTGLIGSLEGLISDNKVATDAQIADLVKKIDALSAGVADEATKIEEVKTSIADLDAKVSEVESAVAGLGEGGCGSGALVVLEIAGAAALLALVLRRKH